MTSEIQPVATWRKVVAGVLDAFTIFFGGGYVIGAATGNLTADGFKLDGGPALILFAIIAAYFIVLPKYFGGTIWQRVLKVR